MRLIKLMLGALCFSLVAATAGASPASPVDKEDYITLDKVQPVAAGHKVEVTEFFAYWCPHCNAFDPALAEWVKAQGDKIVFKRVPVWFHDGDELLQKMYFALEVMGKNEDLHKKIFRAFHVDHKPLRDEASIADFVASQGVDRAKFVDAFNSFGVQTRVQRTAQLLKDYHVDGVPLIAIDGHFETSPSVLSTKLEGRPEPELFAATLKVMDWLVARQVKERSQAVAMVTPAKVKK